MKHQNKWKRFASIEELTDQPTPRPTLTYLAMVLEGIVGKERQQAFSKSLDWTQPVFALVDQYEKKIAAEKQLLIDNTTPPEVDAWSGTHAQADDDAVLAGLAGLSIVDFYQRIIDDLSDEAKDDTMTPKEQAEIYEQIKFWQAKIGKNRNDFDIDEREIRATHESARPTL